MENNAGIVERGLKGYICKEEKQEAMLTDLPVPKEVLLNEPAVHKRHCAFRLVKNNFLHGQEMQQISNTSCPTLMKQCGISQKVPVLSYLIFFR